LRERLLARRLGLKALPRARLADERRAHFAEGVLDRLLVFGKRLLLARFRRIGLRLQAATGQPDYAIAEGTSMASPHVAGVAGLLLAQTPSLNAGALRTRLTDYAVGPATLYGAGLVNAYNSLTQSHGPPTQLFALLYSATTGALDEDNVSVTNGTRGSSPGFNRFHRSADNASSRRHLYEVALQHSAATS